MAAWIFRSDSSNFDLDGYLASTPGAIAWPLDETTHDIQSGDTVYLWRSTPEQGKNAREGIAASAKAMSAIANFSGDSNAAAFWKTAPPILQPSTRGIWLQIERTGNKKEELRSNWLEEDPNLRQMQIFSSDNDSKSIFELSTLEEERIAQMWSRVGQDWTRNESLAGLWAYVETYQKPVSRLAGSPVEHVSQLTGRAIAGVYNKVMNFRSEDSRDRRKGMSGAGLTDKRLWAEFFDPKNHVLNESAIRSEFERIWISASTSPSTTSNAAIERDSFESEVQKLAKRPLEELMKAYHRQAQKSTPQAQTKLPFVKTRTVTQFDRNPLVVAIAKLRASFQCECVNCTHELFKGAGNENYCEVHHITPLAEGGTDDLDNVVCLCPAHHREAHFGIQAQKLKAQFTTLRAHGQQGPSLQITRSAHPTP